MVMGMEHKICAYAKINLTLDVVSKREDGYHNLKTIMQTVSLCDELTLTSAKSGIHLSSTLPFLPTDKRNTVYRAAELFLSRFHIDKGVRIFIKKSIPVCSGMAGGSSDAAAVLKLFNQVFQTGLTTQELAAFGAEIGADVPYCIYGGTALCEGIGDIVTPLRPVPPAIVVLAKPEFSVSTQQVFRKVKMKNIQFHPDHEGMKTAIESADIYGISRRMYNVLEEITGKEHPVVREFERIMLDGGALGSMMSGSGPTVFGLFSNSEDAKKVCRQLQKQTKFVYQTEIKNQPYGRHS